MMINYVRCRLTQVNIINDALVEYFSGNLSDTESSLAHETLEKMRLRARIRSFAWAPPLPSLEPSAIIGTQTTWGQPIVAVANDDNHIAFVATDSPTTTLGAEDEWSGEVLNHFSITPDSENVFAEPDTFDEIMQQQRHISQIAWSPWTVQGDWYHSVLVYATNEDVRARVVTYSGETIGIGNDELIYPDIKLRYAGPMKWSSKVEDGKNVTLALFTLSILVVLKISASDATILARTEHDLDGRWDEMSAAAWDHTAADTSIHFSSLQAKRNHTSQLKHSNDSLNAIPSHPHWREQLWDAQALFSAQHELQGYVRTKVWGLSASPLGDFIAACSTIHPTDMIEYGPPNERRATIAISGLRHYDKDTKLEIPVQNFSAEGFVFTLRKWVESARDGSEATQSIIGEVTNQLFDIHWKSSAAQNLDEVTSLSSMVDLRSLTMHIKLSFLLKPQNIKDRLHILVSQVLAPSQPTVLPRTLIAYRLANSISSLPPALTRATPFSSEIAAHYRSVVNLINAAMAEGDVAPAPTEPCDTCDFCSADIPLEDLETATCQNGHEFSRCGLSFLAIQRPRISKACALCKTPYLSDEFVWVQEEGREKSIERADSEEGRTQPVSLARALFAACDVCIYCGGKFTG
ncbi:uncharacterized protein N0V89_011085 [Didymosphaeria variabile]|uniref:Transcription factor IIIC putative zinc-finger domain-containing protein n=1 Tax=Didymosphaeria variabile TaxID=1932322 RepID=A0A9W8XE60_9PLEO|nr:uncharacterized protein N0V89_011085 [Didymosphaeria variabile]KAJ4347147.1 hypothetical protein N0V89_011085 [Didymosphaeria variabile]